MEGFYIFLSRVQTCPDSIQKKRSPYSIKFLEKHFISKIETCEDFVVVMIDKGDFIVDDCLEPVKLPENYVKMACSDNALYCLSKNDKLLHELGVLGKTSAGLKGLMKMFLKMVWCLKSMFFLGITFRLSFQL